MFATMHNLWRHYVHKREAASKEIERSKEIKTSFYLQSAWDCLGKQDEKLPETMAVLLLFCGLFVGAYMSFVQHKHRSIIQQRKRKFAELKS